MGGSDNQRTIRKVISTVASLPVALVWSWWRFFDKHEANGFAPFGTFLGAMWVIRPDASRVILKVTMELSGPVVLAIHVVIDHNSF